MKIKHGILILCIFGLAGCTSSHSGPGGMHKVAWYEKHKIARIKEINWCNNNTPRQTLSACLNAYQAEKRLTAKKFFSQPKTPYTGGGMTVSPNSIP
ncbi:EexN family lipoprotein [Acidithiobacillus thiooxidans]|uniref:EexN family lipoprotein n=1 Tax=Acidithiobacillus thiooxidans TaxID=930 RepID=UPI001C070032|nr:EexN family lipoprotein [Acidithiobacillus thiooxidans]MBU2834822.1 EexN family lipoprotein [Acidithiobacillus thiooxidans]